MPAQTVWDEQHGRCANVPPHGGRKHPEEKYIQIDTTNILFVCGGTFNGIEEIVRKRTNAQQIGFGRGEARARDEALGELLLSIVEDDLIKFGMIPELVGRLPVSAPLMPLKEDELVRILVEPKNALIRQYQKYFELEGASLEFTDQALHEIAREAIGKNTGARGLRSVIERIMLEPMFNLPSQASGQTYVVGPEVVHGAMPLLERRRKKPA